MSSRIDNVGGIVLNRVFRPVKAAEKATVTSHSRTKPVRISAGADGKQGAKASQAQAPDLSRLNESRKPDSGVSETLGIQDLNARFYVDKRVNRRVVQLRDAESQKLIRQVPTAESLDRIAKLRSFAGKNLDLKI